MKRFSTPLVFVLALVALLLLGACGPFALGTATPRPTAAFVTPTTGAQTPAPTEVTLAPAETPSALPTETPAAPDTATPTTEPPGPTATGIPPTAAPTKTSVPPTKTPVPPTKTPVPPTKTPVPPTPTPVVITDWKGEYYANIGLQGAPAVVRNDRVVDFNLPKGTAPASNMPSENWSARWSRVWRFDEGNYRFHVLVDDGARLWVAGHLLIDAWTDGGAREYTAELYLKGDALVKIEYYNHLGDARVRLNWEPVTQYAGWKGSYFAVANLTGLPVFQRDDANIDFNWGTGSPRGDIPADNFSVTWTRRLDFAAGRYRFDAVADDGVRVYVDGTLVIDAWHDGQGGYQGTLDLAAGPHDVRVDYYEHTGQAQIKVTWTQVAGPTATPTKTPVPPTQTPTPTPPPPPTGIPPTAVPATATPTTVPPTAVPATATPTTVPPTVPPAPTATPTTAPTAPPANPAIVLDPAAGPIAQPINVTGSGWPAGGAVQLLLQRVRQQPAQQPGDPVGQAVADGSGNWQTQIAIPAGEGWEGEDAARVVAVMADANLRAAATYRLRPELTKLKATVIASDDDRFALPQPTYLALDSEQAWTQWFGAEPPTVRTPIDWGREVVLGAFLGEQPTRQKIGVESVVQRGRTVTVHLNVPVAGVDAGAENRAGNRPRVLIRVPRPGPSDSNRAPITYVFVDAQGDVLAQGPAGADPLQPAGAGAIALQAPKVGAGAALSATLPLTETGLAAARAFTETVQQTMTVGQAPAAPQPTAAAAAAAAPAAAAPTVTPPPAAAAGPSPAVWLLIVLGIVALAAIAVYLILRYR